MKKTDEGKLYPSEAHKVLIEGEASHSETLDAFRQFYRRGGVENAALDALKYARCHMGDGSQVILPEWLADAVIKLAARGVETGVSLRAGKDGNQATIINTRRRVMARYLKIQEFRSNGASLEDAYELAVEALKNTDAKGTSHIFIHDYKLIQRAMKDSEEVLTYYPF